MVIDNYDDVGDDDSDDYDDDGGSDDDDDDDNSTDDDTGFVHHLENLGISLLGVFFKKRSLLHRTQSLKKLNQNHLNFHSRNISNPFSSTAIKYL